MFEKMKEEYVDVYQCVLKIKEYFEKILNETKENFKDIEKAVLNKVKPQIEELFNSEGLTFKNKKQISAAEYQTIKTPITIPLDFRQCFASCRHGKAQQESASPAGEILV